MKICTKSRAAKLLGVSRATIYAMIDRGELVTDEENYVDIDQLPRGKYFSKPGRKCKAKNADGNGEERVGEDANDTIARLEKTVADFHQLVDYFYKDVNFNEKKAEMVYKAVQILEKRLSRVEDRIECALTYTKNQAVKLKYEPDPLAREYGSQILSDIAKILQDFEPTIKEEFSIAQNIFPILFDTSTPAQSSGASPVP